MDGERLRRQRGPQAVDAPLLDELGGPERATVGAAGGGREVAWAQRAEVTGAPVPAARPLAARAAGVELPGLVIDTDASIVVCHSEK